MSCQPTAACCIILGADLASQQLREQLASVAEQLEAAGPAAAAEAEAALEPLYQARTQHTSAHGRDAFLL